MNNFFRQLLGSLVQIGINELSKKQMSSVRYRDSADRNKRVDRCADDPSQVTGEEVKKSALC